MKRLLFLLVALFALVPTVYAEDAYEEAFIDIPTAIYTPPTVSFFSSEPSLEEQVYRCIESSILANSSNGALQTPAIINVVNFCIQSQAGETNLNAKLSQSEFLNIYASVVYNHPEIGNLITAFKYTFVNDESSENHGFIELIAPQYRQIYDETTYNSLQTNAKKADYLACTHNVDAYNQAITYAYSKAVSDDMTEDWQKLLSIHDYIVDTATYAPIHSGNYSASVRSAYNAYNNNLVFTPYGALVGDRIAVCQGYALAFKLLCDMAGIECGYAVSDNHIWNIVAVGDNYYHIDATWDDPTSIMVSNGTDTYKCTSPIVLHRHFLRSDADSTALHASEGDWTTNMPECTDSALFNSLLNGLLNDNYGRLNTCLRWEEGTFWFELYEYKLDSVAGRLYYTPSGVFYQLSPNGLETVSKEDYPPAKSLDAQMYNLSASSNSSYIAIDGVANTKADFYAAKYTEGGVLIDVYKTDISFNAYGEAVAEFPNGCNRLFLFADGSIKPLAYSK